MLPGAYYLVRMLDGRIDSQGTVKELRAKGLLDNIVDESSTEAEEKEEEAIETSVKPTETTDNTDKPAKQARKLVQEEERATTRYLVLTTIATFFSSITATTLQLSYQQPSSRLNSVVNLLWFMSLVFSVSSGVSSLLSMMYRKAHMCVKYKCTIFYLPKA